ncbi:MAG: porin [Rhodobacteraceae bacterium]|nr:porin [Paracoccaceae bacterium]
MKKVLLATTALVGLAGAAAAEVTVSGSAEMGIVGGGVNATNGSGGETQFWNDVDVKFTLTGESDSGLSFGADIDLDEAGNLGDEFDNIGTAIFISGAFGTLTLGDTDGAIDWAITDAGNIGNPGSIDDAETSHLGYNGSFGDGEFDNQVLRYDYSFGAVGVAVSYEQGATGGGGVLLAGDPEGTIALGVKYALDLGGTTVNLGGGVSQTDFVGDERQIWALGAAAEFGGGFQAGITYQDWNYDVGEDVTHVGVGLGYESGPISVHANWGQYDFATSDDVDGFGIAAAYDLGGGLSVHAAYADSDDGSTADYATWSLGVAMSF